MSLAEIQPEIIRPIIFKLEKSIRSVLEEHMIGVYIHGSIALGAFIPERSDIDFLVVIDQEIDDEQFHNLQEMHREISASGFFGAEMLEGSYISKAALWKFDPDHCHHTALRCDGTLARDGHGVEWVIQRYVLQEKGIVVTGPKLGELIAPVSQKMLRLAAYDILEDWWLPQLADHSRLVDDEYQAYAILTMSRAFYTIDKGDVTPKLEAANWFKAQYPRWQELVTRAIGWRKGMPFNSLDATLELIRFTLEETRDMITDNSGNAG